MSAVPVTSAASRTVVAVPTWRVAGRVAVLVLGAVVAIRLLAPQLPHVGRAFEVAGSASTGWLVVAALGSALTYLMAGVSLTGAVRDPLPLGQSVISQTATAVAVWAPGGLGPAAVTTRFLSRRGLDAPEALLAVAVNGAAGGAVHGVAMLAALPVALAFLPFELPAATTMAWVTVAVLAGTAAAAELVRRTRPDTFGRLVAAGRDGLAVVAHPRRAAALFGGSAGITAAYVLTLYACVDAVGTPPAWTTVAAIYLAAEAAGTLGGTPGGLGVLEGALIVGLTAAGLTPATAVAAALCYRLLTFWLPTLPGLVALAWMRRAELV